MKCYLLLPMLFIYACNFTTSTTHTMTPNGISINASGFAQVISEISADIQIEVNPDSDYYCFLDCDQAIESAITFDIINDELRIEAKEPIHTNKPIRIHMRVKELKSLNNKSSGNIVVKGGVKASHFKIDNLGSGTIQINDLQSTQLTVQNHGSGNVQLQGKVDQLDAQLLGSGNIEAINLSSAEAEASINGSGNIEVAAISKLQAQIVGSGNIFYKGNPTLQKNITGSGMISAK